MEKGQLFLLIKECSRKEGNWKSPLVNITGGFPGGARGEEPAWWCRRRKRPLVRGYRRSPGGRNGDRLQYSCPENSMGKGAWRAAVHAITDSDVTEHTRPHAQNRSVSCDQKQPRRECRSTQEAGTGSLGSSCLPTRGSLQTTISPPQLHVSLLWQGGQSRFPSLESCRGVSLPSHWEMGTCSPLKAFQAPVSRGASLLYKATNCPGSTQCSRTQRLSIRWPWSLAHPPSPTQPPELEDAKSTQTSDSGNLVSNPVSCLWWSASGTKLSAFLYHEIFRKTSALQAALLAFKMVTNRTQRLLLSISCLLWNSQRSTSKGDDIFFLGSVTMVVQMVKNLSAVQETWVWSLGREDPLKKVMATHSRILVWEI